MRYWIRDCSTAGRRRVMQSRHYGWRRPVAGSFAARRPRTTGRRWTGDGPLWTSSMADLGPCLACIQVQGALHSETLSVSPPDDSRPWLMGQCWADGAHPLSNTTTDKVTFRVPPNIVLICHEHIYRKLLHWSRSEFLQPTICEKKCDQSSQKKCWLIRYWAS